MNVALLRRRFERIGARVKVNDVTDRFRRAGIDIRADEEGEFFDIRVLPGDAVEYVVTDVRPEMRHLLLMARRGDYKQKFLCGHDERHWFVCAVPGRSVASVVDAMQALQPAEVRRGAARRIRRIKDRLRRRNAAFVRQGEWFFVPAPEGSLPESPLILRNEPISRGRGGKPHVCEELFRTGGERVYVSPRRPGGITEAQYADLVRRRPSAANWGWNVMTRGAAVYVRGRVSHADHKTVVLRTWHRVLMNTEGQAEGAESVVFLD
ncbi:MAG TPA: hypothetical protein VIP46_00080 [Pyrinomonadaceae bacterium]